MNRNSKPAKRAACLAGACPTPACTTHPMKTSSTFCLSSPDRSTAFLIARDPSLVALKLDSDPEIIVKVV